MPAARRRSSGIKAPVVAKPSQKTVTIAVQIPDEAWRKFQIALVLDRVKMQDWVKNTIKEFLEFDWNEVQPDSESYKRISRKGRTRQVIARIPAEWMPAFQLRLAKLLVPTSRWLYDRILEYTADLDRRLEEAKDLREPRL